MNLVRTVRATVLGDGIADAVTFDVRALPDAAGLVVAPEHVTADDADVRAILPSRSNPFLVTLAWKKGKAPDKEDTETVSLRLHFPQG